MCWGAGCRMSVFKSTTTDEGQKGRLFGNQYLKLENTNCCLLLI